MLKANLNRQKHTKKYTYTLTKREKRNKIINLKNNKIN